jgi:hypothetical protein
MLYVLVATDKYDRLWIHTERTERQGAIDFALKRHPTGRVVEVATVIHHGDYCKSGEHTKWLV